MKCGQRTIGASGFELARVKVRFLLVVVLLGAAGTAFSQCTKDIDCKGDRICEKGTCMTPGMSAGTPPFAVPPVLVIPMNMTMGATEMGRNLEKVLQCERNPEPVVVLGTLAAHHYIGPKAKAAIDGAEVFDLKRPLSVYRLKVIEVSGFDPEFGKGALYRGPGTTPSLSFSVVVSGAPGTVKTAIKDRLSKHAIVEQATYSRYAKPATEITCFGH